MDTRDRGFTLIELLVVVVIILGVSAVALPTVLPALRHRQVSEAARLVQGALVGARDAAIRTNAPAGIRLLPDPAWPIVYLPSGQIDPTVPLAANRIVPLEAGPNYTEGAVSTYPGSAYAATVTGGLPALVLEESVGSWRQPDPTKPFVFLPNSPTSWFWNIRIGDRIQINQAGPWYTVIGPMTIAPAAATGNSELFANIGTPGTQSPLSRTINSPDGQSVTVTPEFLLLVNGLDDNANGWVDEGFDGVDNNNNGTVDELLEWEPEVWRGGSANSVQAGLPYTVQRRPVPSGNAREIALPSNVVVDLTGWNTAAPPRSRVPVNQFTGSVDLLVQPNGTVVPQVIYSTPTSVGMTSAFLHLWLAERSDVAAPVRPPAGQCWLLSVTARTGRVTETEQPSAASNPFVYAQQGGR
jgi:prepilin-type N-terminal cleavage/methylation domain-containing protein